jgi:hypothetical protein
MPKLQKKTRNKKVAPKYTYIAYDPVKNEFREAVREAPAPLSFLQSSAYFLGYIYLGEL